MVLTFDLRRWVVLIVASAVLAGCGEFSAFDLLGTQDPGPFAMNQSEVSLESGSQYQLSARGGFRDYRFEKASGDGQILDPLSGVYQAPVLDDVEESTAVLRGRDRVGTTGLTTVYTHKKLTVVPSTVSIASNSVVPVDLEVTITGGYGAKSVTEPDHGTASLEGDTLFYTPLHGVGRYTLEITDSIDNSAYLTVYVYDDEELFVSPMSATVTVGSSVVFTVGGYTSDFYVDPPDGPTALGTITVDGDTIIFSADEVIDDPQELHITVTDGDVPPREVMVTVYVVPTNPDPLSLSPSGASVSDGAVVEFTASGGVQPYDFKVSSGQLESVSDTTVRYTASFPPGSAQVEVTDFTGNRAVAKLKVSR